MNLKNIIACQICGGSFDSTCKECKKCEYYSKGINKYGRTKTNAEYQIEMLAEEIHRIKSELV